MGRHGGAQSADVATRRRGLEPIAPALEHISLMQGYKVYGAHLGAFKTPARESDAGHMPPEFNMAQQRYLVQRQAGKRWHWSAIRPSVVGASLSAIR